MRGVQSESPSRHPHQVERLRLAILAVLLLAFALRAYHLDYQSLWSDEGISLQRSLQPVAAMLRNMPAEHVPGYFVLLHGWIRLTGTHDFALRYFSLLPSVASVALLFRLGVAWGSQRSGLIASLLLATGTFQVWYAQEVRMYSWLLAANLGSTWAFWRLLTDESRGLFIGWRTWLLYVITTLLSIYLHFFGFLIPIAHILLAGCWLLIWREWRAVKRWIWAGLLIFVLFLPWLWRTLALFRFTGWREPIDPGTLPWMLLRTYTIGPTLTEPLSTWLPWVYVGLATLGAWFWLRRWPAAGLFLTANLAVALAIVWAAVVRNPDFHVRYTIWLSAPLVLLVSGGCARISRLGFGVGKVEGHRSECAATWAMAALVGGLVAANGWALHGFYTDEQWHKPNFRAAATHITAHERAGDLILVDGPNPELVFLHYYQGRAPVVDLRYLLDADAATINVELESLTADASRTWEVLLFHGPGPVQVWTATQAWIAATEFFNTIRVSLYGLDHAPMQEHTVSVMFNGTLELRAAAVEAGPVQPGDLVRVTTRWFVHEQAEPYKFSLRLSDRNGQIVWSDDYVPQNWFAPTNIWVVGQEARDQHGLLLPDQLPPGDYQLTLRLYDADGGLPVETSAGIDVPLAPVIVEAG